MCSKQYIVLGALVAVLVGVTTVGLTAQEDPKPRPPTDNPPPDRGPRRAEWTEEDIEALYDILQERSPQQVDRLKRLRDTDPQVFHREIRRLIESGRLGPILAMRRHDPDGFKLHMEAMAARAETGRMRRQLHEAGDAETEALRAQLRAAAERVVDAEFKLREHELTMLKKRLAELESELANRLENRDALVEQYFQRLSAPPLDPPPGDAPRHAPGAP